MNTTTRTDPMNGIEGPPSYPGTVPADSGAQSQRLSFWARMVLVPVAVIGAVLSFHSLYEAAVPTFGGYLAAGFPLLVDLLILGASVQYVAGAKVGRPMTGWRLTAHAGVAATLALNALAATKVGDVPWHITAPAVWAVLVELTAKQVLGEWKATHTDRTDSISLTLWLTAPVESARTRLLMLRTGTTDAHLARTTVGVHAAAREALRLALPTRRGQHVRRIINRQLRAGSLPPAAILTPLGWSGSPRSLPDLRPETILRAVLHGVLDPTADGGVAEAVSPTTGDADENAPQASARPEIDEPDRTGTDEQDIGTVPAPRPAPRVSTTTPRRTTGPSSPGSTAVRVARLRDKHPAWTVKEIAAKAGVTERTVRRHLNTASTQGTDTTEAATDAAA